MKCRLEPENNRPWKRGHETTFNLLHSLFTLRRKVSKPKHPVPSSFLKAIPPQGVSMWTEIWLRCDHERPQLP